MSRSKSLHRVADLFANNEAPPSRNAAYEAYRHPSFVAAVRLHRHLRTLADALVALDAKGDAGSVLVAEEADGRTRFTFTHEDIRRQAFVRPDEVEVLRLDPTVERVLQKLGVAPASKSSADTGQDR